MTTIHTLGIVDVDEADAGQPFGEMPELIRLNGHQLAHVASCPCQPPREPELPAGFSQTTMELETSDEHS